MIRSAQRAGSLQMEEAITFKERGFLLQHFWVVASFLLLTTKSKRAH